MNKIKDRNIAIPPRVTRRRGWNDEFFCRNCGYQFVVSAGENYCGNCGQRVKHSSYAGIFGWTPEKADEEYARILEEWLKDGNEAIQLANE